MARGIRIEIEGLEELIERVGAGNVEAAIENGMDDWALLLAADLGTYPPPRPRPMVFKTEKQRRGFFARLKDGRIKIPYRRDRTLGRSWVPKKPGAGQRVVATNVPYAKWVQGRSQARYHKGNWPFYGNVAKNTKDRGLALIGKQLADLFD